jgi:hypothetical protein
MNRRSFFKLSAAAAVAAVTPLTAEEFSAQSSSETPEPNWWDTIEETFTHEAQSDEGSLRLRVTLITPDNITERTTNVDQDDVIRYEFEGALLPSDFTPDQNLLRAFRFTWDDRVIQIPKSLWWNLSGLRLQTSTLDPMTVPFENRFAAEQFLAGLMQPRLTLSADSTTAMIEWQRSEDCDSRSTIRWLISRSGTVLRHRYSEGCAC